MMMEAAKSTESSEHFYQTLPFGRKQSSRITSTLI